MQSCNKITVVSDKFEFDNLLDICHLWRQPNCCSCYHILAQSPSSTWSEVEDGIEFRIPTEVSLLHLTASSRMPNMLQRNWLNRHLKKGPVSLSESHAHMELPLPERPQGSHLQGNQNHDLPLPGRFHLGQETVRHLLPVSPGGNLRRDNSSSSSPSPHLGCFPTNSSGQGGKIVTAQESPHVVGACRSVEVAQASDDFTESFDQSLGVHILVHQPLVLWLRATHPNCGVAKKVMQISYKSYKMYLFAIV